MSDVPDAPAPLDRWLTQAGLDAFPMPSYVYTPDGLLVAGNAAAEAFWKVPNAALINSFNLVDNGEQLGAELVDRFKRCAETGESQRAGATLFDFSQGSELPTNERSRMWLQIVYFPLLDERGATRFILGMGFDVSEEMRRKEEVERAAAQIEAQRETIATLEAARAEIERQRETIEALSSPIIDVWRGVVLLPLTGEVERARVSVIVERLLAAISAKHARYAIIDLTGVAQLDTGSANQLIRIRSMVSLLGAECVLAGIQPAVARTITTLEINLGQVNVFNSLRDALQYCMDR